MCTFMTILPAFRGHIFLLLIELGHQIDFGLYIKETKSATMNIFQIFYFLFKSFVIVELSYVFTINLSTLAENCTQK